MYDYIVVGAGSAGCAVAARLSEHPRTQVLLLEAGGEDRDRNIHVPYAWRTLIAGEADWAYETEPQRELNGRRILWPRGKVLGGSSSLNAMMFLRGCREDFEGWKALGNPGWGFDDVLPWFKKCEDREQGPSEFHGAGGPLHVSDPRFHDPLTDAFVAACQAAGMPLNPDFNGASLEGVGTVQFNIKNGERHSSAKAYLTPIRNRPNLKTVTHALATRIRFTGVRAMGVEFEIRGQAFAESAAKEIVLCGGAINSPQLLMLSGVGPSAHLRELDIPVVHDLPGVGENLQDHLNIAVRVRSRQPSAMSRADSWLNRIRYVLSRTGPLTTTGLGAVAYIKTSPSVTVPDSQLMFWPVWARWRHLPPPHGFGYSGIGNAIRPESVGTVRLRSGSSHDKPLIDPKYLSDRRDLSVSLLALKRLRAVFADSRFDPFRGAEIAPGLKAQSDEDLIGHIRSTASTYFHPVGTCKMGTDAMAVVDPRLTVRGIEGLRVADASIMPRIVSANTHAATVMIGERAAGMIAERN